METCETTNNKDHLMLSRIQKKGKNVETSHRQQSTITEEMYETSRTNTECNDKIVINPSVAVCFRKKVRPADNTNKCSGEVSIVCLGLETYHIQPQIKTNGQLIQVTNPSNKSMIKTTYF